MVEQIYWHPTREELQRIELRSAEQRVFNAERELEAAKVALAKRSQ